MYETKILQLEDKGRPGVRLKRRIDAALCNRIIGIIDTTKSIDSIVNVLEIGTGTGRIAKMLLRTEPRMNYFGVEPASTLRDVTSKSLSEYEARANVIDSRLPELEDVPIGNFDICLMFHLLEHAPDYYQANAWMASVYSRLKPGGRVIIICPNIFDYKGFFYDVDWSHAYPTTTKRIKDLGIDVGFNINQTLDLRCNSNKIYFKLALRLILLFFPIKSLNRVGEIVFKIPYIGVGIAAAVFWRNSWVVLEKPLDA